MEYGKVISVIENEQPSLFTLLQPMYYCRYEFAMICLVFLRQRMDQRCYLYKASDNRFFVCGIDPERVSVPMGIARSIGIFNRDLGFADATKSFYGLRLC